MHDTPSPEHRVEADGQHPSVVMGNDGSHWEQVARQWAAEQAWRTGSRLDVRLWNRLSEVPDTVPDNGGLHWAADAAGERARVRSRPPCGTWKRRDAPHAWSWSATGGTRRVPSASAEWCCR